MESNFNPQMTPVETLKSARQALMLGLPVNHDLNQRVQGDGGDLRLVQPSGRPREVSSSPSLRRKIRDDPDDPNLMIQRRQLMKMWNENYDMTGEWEKAFIKMQSNRIRLGMRECSDAYCKADEIVSGSGFARNYASKRRNADFKHEEVIDGGRIDRITQPGQQKRPEATKPSSRCRDGRVESKSGQNTRKRSPSPSKGTLTVTKSFPSAEEVLAAVPAGGIDSRSFLDIFWDRMSEERGRFRDLLSGLVRFDPENKLLVPKDRSASDAGSCFEGKPEAETQTMTSGVGKSEIGNSRSLTTASEVSAEPRQCNWQLARRGGLQKVKKEGTCALRGRRAPALDTIRL